jgi:hypothetical protein
VAGVGARVRARAGLIERYRNAYGHHCWKVECVEDLRIAP